MKVLMGISGFFISLLLGQSLVKPDPAVILFYLILPLPLNILMFCKAFRDYVDSRVNPHGDGESEIQTKA